MAAAPRRRRPAKCLGSTGSGGPTSPAARVSARVAVWGWGGSRRPDREAFIGLMRGTTVEEIEVEQVAAEEEARTGR